MKNRSKCIITEEEVLEYLEFGKITTYDLTTKILRDKMISIDENKLRDRLSATLASLVSKNKVIRSCKYNATYSLNKNYNNE